MNPLTLVKRIQSHNAKEAALGISEEASWHAKYKDSAYVFVGGIPFELTEGDLLAVFAQYGEIVDVNLVRDKGTGKSKGFAFVAYEDQRSTILAVDNLNGAQILGRIIRVDHAGNYKKKEEEDEETVQQKREARGVCRAFQRGDCNRGAGCKFSHDEQRAANTGWGAEDNKNPRWGHEKFEGSMRNEKRSGQSNRVAESATQEGLRIGDKDARSYRARGFEASMERHSQSRDRDSIGLEKRSEQKGRGTIDKEDRDTRATEKRSRRHDSELNSREDRDRKEQKGSRMHNSESYHREDRHKKIGDKRSAHDRDSSSHRRRGVDEDHQHRSHR